MKKNTKKLDFKDVKKVLSRDEMRKIMAGSSPCGFCGPTVPCYYNPLIGCGCAGGTVQCFT